MDYGAANDGTDAGNRNQQAILNAMSDKAPDGYTLIYFPAGDYLISTPIVLNGADRLVFRGDGSENTRLLFDFGGQDLQKSFSVWNSRNIGFENFYITRRESAPFGENFFIHSSSDSWISGIESFQASTSHVVVADSDKIDVTGSYFHHAWSYGTGGQGYGIVLGFKATRVLMENNIFAHLRHSIILSNDPQSNVAGYNFSTDPYTTEVYLGITDWPSDMCLHGHPDPNSAGPSRNLFEGNIGTFMHADNAWGDNGPHNTYFRNRATYYGIRIQSVAPDQNVIANEVNDADGAVVKTYGSLGDSLWNAFNIESVGNFVVGNTNFDPSVPVYPAPEDASGDLSLYFPAAEIPDFLKDLPYFPPIGVVDAAHQGGGTNPARMRWGAPVMTVPHPPHPLAPSWRPRRLRIR